MKFKSLKRRRRALQPPRAQLGAPAKVVRPMAPAILPYRPRPRG